jgi:crossover junction endodeoxyribonuclease RuvC
MSVIGIDPSLTSTGLVALASWAEQLDGLNVTTQPYGGDPGRNVHERMNRIEHITREVLASVQKHKPTVICVEGYSLGHNTPGTADRLELGGLLRYSICRECASVYEVAPSTLKKWATGKHTSDKVQVAVALSKRYGVEFQNDDMYDAYALARMALQIAGHDEPATKQQREAIETVMSSKPKKTKKA